MTRFFVLLTSLRVVVVVAALAPLLALIFIHPLSPAVAVILASASVMLLGLRLGFRLSTQQRFAAREQANLSEIANGLADCRRYLDETRGVLEGERNNLGQVADAVYRLRLLVETATSSAGGGVSDRLDMLDRRVDEQSANLGKVAGGLDEFRHASAGVDLIQGRYAALSDSIIDIAAHVDVLSRTILAREPTRSDEARQTAAS